MHRKQKLTPKRIALCGMLLSLMLVLGWVEHMIPLNAAVPGIKLGLSNGVLIFALYMLDLPTAWLLMILKVTLSALFFSAGSFPYAMAGGAVSMLAMMVLSRQEWAHPVTVSIVGGVMHNVGQVLMAILVVKTPGLLSYMAALMVVGLACGALTGICATMVMKHLKHMKW